MSRTTTPKYTVEFTGFVNCAQTPFAWKGRLPSVAKLEQFVMEHVVATYPGMCNETIGKVYGIQIPSRAVVRENGFGGRVLVEWNAAKFTVMPNAADYPKVAKAFSL